MKRMHILTCGTKRCLDDSINVINMGWNENVKVLQLEMREHLIDYILLYSHMDYDEVEHHLDESIHKEKRFFGCNNEDLIEIGYSFFGLSYASKICKRDSRKGESYQILVIDN